MNRIDELKNEFRENTGDDPDDYAYMSEDDWTFGLGEDGARELVTLLEQRGEARGEALSQSEHYAAGRMTHAVITRQALNTVQNEVVHDALMAAFQAGYLASAEGTPVDELLARMAELD